MAAKLTKSKETKLRDILAKAYGNILFPQMKEAGMPPESCAEKAQKAAEDTLKLAAPSLTAKSISKAFNSVVRRDAFVLQAALLIIENVEKIGLASQEKKQSAAKIRGAGKKPSVKKKKPRASVSYLPRDPYRPLRASEVNIDDE